MAPLLVASLLLAGVDVNWNALLRNELRGRTFGLNDQQTALPFAIDFELQPNASLEFVTPRWRFVTGYTPRIILRNIDSGKGQPVVLQRWSGDLTLRVSRTVTLALAEQASYGVTDFSSLIGLTSSFDATQLAPRLEAIPLGGLKVTTTSSRTQLSLTGRASKRVSTSAGIYYYVSGGVTPADQASLPLQYGPGAFVDAAYLIARRQTIAAHFTFAQTDFTTGQSFTLAELTGRWVYVFDTGSQLTGQAGVATVRGYLPADAFYTITIAPYVRAAYQQTVQTRLGAFVLQLTAGMAPFLDRVLAAFYERVELGASGLWRVNETLTLRLQAQWTIAVLDRNYQGQQLSLTEAGALVRLSRRLTFDAGARVLYSQPAQTVAQAATPAQLQWLAFIGLSGSFGGDF
jgi:hypothetical protein